MRKPIIIVTTETGTVVSVLVESKKSHYVSAFLNGEEMTDALIQWLRDAPVDIRKEALRRVYTEFKIGEV